MWEVEFGGGAEFDEADALSALEDFVFFAAGDDGACDGAGDLSDGGDALGACVVFEDDECVFVEFGGFGFECVHFEAGCVGDGDDAAVAWTAIDMDIKYGEKDANTFGGSIEGFEVFDIVDGADFAIGGADHGGAFSGDFAEGVAEEGEACERDEDDDCHRPIVAEDEEENGECEATDSDDNGLWFAVRTDHWEDLPVC